MLDSIRALFVPARPANHVVVTSRRPAVDWAAVRRPLSAIDFELTDESQRWLWHIAEFAWPSMLCASHPRIVNQIAPMWNRPDECEAFLADLLTDKRAGRRGFTPSIRAELVRLARFYQAVKPEIERRNAETAQLTRAASPRTG